MATFTNRIRKYKDTNKSFINILQILLNTNFNYLIMIKLDLKQVTEQLKTSKNPIVDERSTSTESGLRRLTSSLPCGGETRYRMCFFDSETRNLRPVAHSGAIFYQIFLPDYSNTTEDSKPRKVGHLIQPKNNLEYPTSREPQTDAFVIHVDKLHKYFEDKRKSGTLTELDREIIDNHNNKIILNSMNDDIGRKNFKKGIIKSNFLPKSDIRKKLKASQLEDTILEEFESQLSEYLTTHFIWSKRSLQNLRQKISVTSGIEVKLTKSTSADGYPIVVPTTGKVELFAISAEAYKAIFGSFTDKQGEMPGFIHDPELGLNLYSKAFSMEAEILDLDSSIESLENRIEEVPSEEQKLLPELEKLKEKRSKIKESLQENLKVGYDIVISKAGTEGDWRTYKYTTTIPRTLSYLDSEEHLNQQNFPNLVSFVKEGDNSKNLIAVYNNTIGYAVDNTSNEENESEDSYESMDLDSTEKDDDMPF